MLRHLNTFAAWSHKTTHCLPLKCKVFPLKIPRSMLFIRTWYFLLIHGFMPSYPSLSPNHSTIELNSEASYLLYFRHPACKTFGIAITPPIRIKIERKKSFKPVTLLSQSSPLFLSQSLQVLSLPSW